MKNQTMCQTKYEACLPRVQAAVNMTWDLARKNKATPILPLFTAATTGHFGDNACGTGFGVKVNVGRQNWWPRLRKMRVDSCCGASLITGPRAFHTKYTKTAKYQQGVLDAPKRLTEAQMLEGLAAMFRIMVSSDGSQAHSNLAYVGPKGITPRHPGEKWVELFHELDGRFIYYDLRHDSIMVATLRPLNWVENDFGQRNVWTAMTNTKIARHEIAEGFDKRELPEWPEFPGLHPKYDVPGHLAQGFGERHAPTAYYDAH